MSTVSARDMEWLIDAARRGSSDALGQLLEMYRHYVALLTRMQADDRLRGKVSESDILQETFLEARKGFEGFRGTTEGEFMAWLRKVLASRMADFADHYGAEKRDVKLERQLDTELSESSQMLDRALVARGSSPSLQASRREQAVLLADALAELPPHQREAIVLRNLKGLSFAEVAQRMGRTQSSVKNLWLRGLEKLRLQFGDDE